MIVRIHHCHNNQLFQKSLSSGEVENKLELLNKKLVNFYGTCVPPSVSHTEFPGKVTEHNSDLAETQSFYLVPLLY